MCLLPVLVASGPTPQLVRSLPEIISSLLLTVAGKLSIESAHFPGVFLRLDGTGLSPAHKPPNGGGVVNCQQGASEWEKFRLVQLEGNVTTIESVQFPGVYIRMDGSSVKSKQLNGGGVVNAQVGAQAWEKFKLHPSGEGKVTIESAQFPGVFLRMDGRNVPRGGNGGGVVNCQWGAGEWEQFKIHGIGK